MMFFWVCLQSWLNTLIWSNYSDLTRPHPKWWFSKEFPFFREIQVGEILYFGQINAFLVEAKPPKMCLKCWQQSMNCRSNFGARTEATSIDKRWFPSVFGPFTKSLKNRKWLEITSSIHLKLVGCFGFRAVYTLENGANGANGAQKMMGFPPGLKSSPGKPSLVAKMVVSN